MKNVLYFCFFISCSTLAGCTSAGSSSQSSPGFGTWSTASSFGFFPRENFTTSVVNGKIYAIGGNIDSSGSHGDSAVQVFDPIANSWSTPAINGTFFNRGSYSASVVNGKIYVIGGEDGNPEDSLPLQIFDPSTNTWSIPSTTGNYEDRYEHTATVVNGKIYVIGGSGLGESALQIPVEVFDPSTNSWSYPSIDSENPGGYRRGASACSVNGKIFIFGGNVHLIGFIYNRDSIDEYDPATNMWSSPMTTEGLPPSEDPPCDEVNGIIYMMGASHPLQYFDPSTNALGDVSTTGNYTERAGMSAIAVGGKVYFMGGFSLNGGGTLNTVEVFTPAQ
jgi:N-acetylneuraminic acid mutarotase